MNSAPFEEITFSQHDIQDMIEEQSGYERDPLSFGILSQNSSECLETIMKRGIQHEFNFLVAPLFNEKGRQNIATTEYLTQSESWSNALVGIVKGDSLIDQIGWARYLSIPAIQIDLAGDIDVLGHVLNQNLESINSCWVYVKYDQWSKWNSLRCKCDHNPKLFVTLEIPVDLPDNEFDLTRWIAEPVKSLILPGDLFYRDLEGLLTLSRCHRVILEKFFEFQLQIVLEWKGHDLKGECSLIHDIYAEKTLSEEEYMCKPFNDFLQTPLQPLMNNLSSSTYEIFEKDSTKYDQYEKAMYQALIEMKNRDFIVIYILGAGRGGLVKRAIRAVKKAKVSAKIIAVEKNPNAIQILRHFKNIIWDENVHIVQSDMREVKGEMADLIVSELLGSFGDNELSPECLEGVSHLTKKDTIYIPQNYTSFCSLIYSTRIWKSVRAMGTREAFETPYVVRVHQHHLLSNIQECFKFCHPNEHKCNERFKKIEFYATQSGVVHGIVGYFESRLYGQHFLSIHPDSSKEMNDGMFSWFPIYFPILHPLSVIKGEKITLSIWRCCNKYKVWYEWSISSQHQDLSTHNVNGRSSWVGLL